MPAARTHHTRRWIPVLLLLAVALIFHMDLMMLGAHAAGLIHQGFLAVYVDAGSFVSGCF
jgi:hypothetical protein